MSLVAGDKLGHYQIVAPLGAGGMGEVYRARDSRLGREVAIKVLPELFSQDPERMARFTREAQTLASLNHPNIGAIYGVEERALVLELIEGPTLADRIAQGAIPFDEALPLIRQLIDALDYAHQKNVVHRDLKPANIKITPEGKLKILDFGLAKALSGQQQPVSTADPTNSPTLTLVTGTMAGVILGTAAYMAPEQARGKAVDKRADIWAFGVVVYEMLSGRQLFEGESVSDVLAQTLTKPIDLATVPASARPLLRRCLERDSNSRLRDLGDAHDLLQSVVPTAPPSPKMWIAGVLTALALAVVFAVLWQRAASRHASDFQVRMALSEPRISAPISPDGSTLLWIGNDGLVLRRLSDLRPRTLPGTEGATFPFWSGDSAAIGFFQQGKLCIMPVATQEVRSVMDAPLPGGAAWRGSVIGGDIVFISEGKLMHLSLASGVASAIPAALPAGTIPFNPAFLPQGTDFVFIAGLPERDAATLFRLPLSGGTPVRLMETPSQVQFARHPRENRWYMFYSLVGAIKLMTVPIDPATGQKTGEPVQLVDGVGSLTGSRRIVVDVSESGSITFRRNFAAAPVFRIRWHAPDGRVLATLGEKIASNDMVLSPDESHVATLTGFPRRGISIVDTRTGGSRRVSDSAENVSQGMAWSRDGSTLYYGIEQPDGTATILKHVVDGTSRPESIGHADSPLTIMDISVDGQYLILGPSQRSGVGYSFLKTSGPPSSSPTRWITFGPAFLTRGAQARFTPDGKYLLIPGASEGRFIPWLPDQPVPPVNNGTFSFSLAAPFFSRDGRQLCGVDRHVNALACSSFTSASGQPPTVGPPTVQFSSEVPQLSSFGNIGAVSKDGRILLLSTDEPEEVGLQFLSDWTALLPSAAK